MALEKQGLNIPFGQGLDLKTDPNQVAAGKMLALSNVVFDNGAQLHKRNGFPLLTTLPVTTNTVLSTYKQNLISTGANLYAHNATLNTWSNRGSVQPVDISVQPLVRNSVTQSSGNSAIAPNGLTCTAFVQSSAAYYQITQNGQVIQSITALPANSSTPKVVLLNNSFAIVYSNSVSNALTCLMIPMAQPTSAGTSTTLVASTMASPTGYDIIVANNFLYFAWQDSVSITVKINRMDIAGNLLFANAASSRNTTKVGTYISITADTSTTTATIWVSSWDSGTTTTWCSAWSFDLYSTAVLAATSLGNLANITRITSSAVNNILTIFSNVSTAYSYNSHVTPTMYKGAMTIAGSATAFAVFKRSITITSKPFTLSDGNWYIFGIYQENANSLQPTIFLFDYSANILARIAGSNAATMDVQPVPVDSNDVAYFTYGIKDFVATINTTATASQNPAQAPNGLFSNIGINLATVTINASQQSSSEIAQSLHLTGGQLWQYDGTTPIEHGFHVYPEDLYTTKANSTGTLINQQYYYIAVYEWTDNNGMLHRSAPSLPCGMLLAGAEDTITVYVPTLRLTAKSNVRVCIYRWSTAQPVYYMITSISSPLLNDPTVDNVSYVDGTPDSGILGNTILYTTGGVIENIAAPASFASALFKSRLFLASAEDRNVIWYSKIVLEGTPVEMSDLQTIYVSPTSGAQGSTGAITALSALDDKLIVFKKDAIYYVTGNGPDATGANNDFSEPVYVTGSVGCNNPRSITQTPQGLMFQSDKGIWLLGRDLSTSYIGAPMEAYNGVTVLSGLTIPATNQVRFTLDNGTVLMYDYYFAQWATFNGIPAISSCLYNSLHTYLNQYGQVMQENLSSSLDYTTPVTMSFTTAWLKLTNLQGFQRAYFFYLLGTYVSPHKLTISIAYDYDPTIRQTVTYTPPNTPTTYGAETIYGGGTYGGADSSVEQFRVFLQQQKCQSIQITVQESYDPSKSVAAGGGLNLSGINLVVGAKKGHPVLPAVKSVG